MATIPKITKSLEYDVKIVGNLVIKTPHKGFEYKVEIDYNRLKALGSLAPVTKYDRERNILIQQAIKGRFARENEMGEVVRAIKAKGYIPRGLLPQDVIVIRVRGQKAYKVVDVGNFEKIPTFML